MSLKKVYSTAKHDAKSEIERILKRGLTKWKLFWGASKVFCYSLHYPLLFSAGESIVLRQNKGIGLITAIIWNIGNSRVENAHLVVSKVCCMRLTYGTAQIPVKSAGGKAKNCVRSQPECVKEVALSYNFLQNNKFRSVSFVCLHRKDAAKTGLLFS